MSNPNTNEIKNMPKLYGGELNPIYNNSDFQSKSGYVTFADLLYYANLYSVNVFYSLNQFFAITVTSINDISDVTLSYLKNVTSDIQDQFDNIINNILYNYSYDPTNQLTSIQNNTYLKTISTNNNVAIAGKVGITDTLNTSTINNIKIKSQKIDSENMTCKSLLINNCPIDDTGIYLYLSIVIEPFGGYTSSMLTIPIFKSVLISQLRLDTNENFVGYLIIKPLYRIDILDINKNVLFSFTNNTDEIIYFQPMNIVGEIYKINLFYNSILI